MKFLVLAALFSYCSAGYLAPAAVPVAKVLNTGSSVQQRAEDGLGNYNFGYNEDHSTGGSSRQESGDAYGNVAGSYSLRDADGRLRTVNYVADHLGFRANVQTNEPGTAPQDPAAVVQNGPDAIHAAPVVAKQVVAAPVIAKQVLAAPAYHAPVLAAPAYGYAGIRAPITAAYGPAVAHYGAAPLAAHYGAAPLAAHYGAAPLAGHYGAAPLAYGGHYAAPAIVKSAVSVNHVAPAYGPAIGHYGAAPAIIKSVGHAAPLGYAPY